MPIITFTSDFGMSDVYVGVVHGVVAQIAPSARLIDLTHGIPPQDVTAGALALYAACPHFPIGTIHLAVVDPGVGTSRRAIVLRAEEQWFVGPDNGLFSLVAPPGPDVSCWQLTNRRYWRSVVSSTFHGRDIFAPAAAHLAIGVPPDELGTPIDAPVPLPGLQLRQIDDRETTGHVLSVDHFGNLITNLRATARWTEAVRTGAAYAWIADRPVHVVRAYGEAPTGSLVALAGSSGLLEVAVVNGSAAALAGLGVGASVRVQVG